MLGQEFSWQNASIIYLGRVITGCQGVQGKVSQASQLNYGLGEEPHSYSKGARTYMGTITLLYSEILALMKYAQDNGYTDLCALPPFIITKTFTLPGDTKVYTKFMDVLHIQELDDSWQQQDMSKSITLPLLVGRIRDKQ